MRLRELTEGVGRITKQNQTVDVGPDEVTKQAAKFGNKVDKDGRPPTLSKKEKDDLEEAHLDEEKYTTAFLKKLIAKAEAMADKDFSQYTPADHAFMDKFFGYHLPNMINQFGDMAGVAAPLLQSQYYEDWSALRKRK